ncbi:MAG: UDP-N-acetylglucosamine--N-acetylmuramyl-(pentapeptide) pyrophosphoryl-undecaprenol N-acetylglucosamine transferase, partial [Mycobacterium sp.]|nr:UDP-N-acetylglucosamine--N-acetylmuramyl-(pentapeptide) pyrophosphoryl-undecaprenol N-acetylglucosamine transferase [Mycobacterium sp.]
GTEVARLVTDSARLAAMAAAAAGVGHRDGARRVAAIVLAVAHAGREVRR